MGGEGGGRTEDAQVFGVDTLSRAASCRDGAGSPCSPGLVQAAITALPSL